MKLIFNLLVVIFLTFLSTVWGESIVSDNSQKDFVPIEGGIFQMGSTSVENEKPIHQVTLSKFNLCKHEVTVGEFKRFTTDTGYTTEAEKGEGSYVWTSDGWDKKIEVNWKNPYFSQNDNCPVACISWNDAIEYCNWLSNKEGLSLCYKGKGDSLVCDFQANGYRLPTEAEWEYAAKGGKYSKHYKYSGSNTLNDVAWFWDNSGEKSHEVMTKLPNELGIFDMSGNIWEWCWDRNDLYSAKPQKNPIGSIDGVCRILRGGAWYFGAEGCRLTGRGMNYINYRNYGYGFRLCKTTN